MGCLKYSCKKIAKKVIEINQNCKKYKKTTKENQEDKINASTDSKGRIVLKKIKDNNNIYTLYSNRIITGLDDIQTNSDIKSNNSMKIKNKNNKNYKNIIQNITNFFKHKNVEDQGRINNNYRYQEEEKIIKFMKAPTREEILNEDHTNEEKNLIKKNNDL